MPQLHRISLVVAALSVLKCTALHQQHAQKFLQTRRGFDSVPFCQFGRRVGFNDAVAVYINSDNSRSFSFGAEDTGTQSQISCNGPVPSHCASRLSSNPRQISSCEEVSCSCKADASSLQFVYMKKMMQEAVPLCEVQASNFQTLMIGLGGGALPEYLLAHCPEGTSVESVEYDPRVIDVATKFFGLRVAPGVSEIENNDGGKSVQARAAAGKKYDLILVDCFQSEGYVPDSCRDEAFVSGLHALLKSGGVAIQQVWGGQYKETLSTYQHVFGQEHAIGIDAELEVSWLIKASLASAIG
mmetsp:Transcript_39272/g.72309  ORF Transcript_39272/g.72309 Transcript_39272/m.72309 type:complete len:299 (+) Transcript_39272:78-974(+)